MIQSSVICCIIVTVVILLIISVPLGDAKLIANEDVMYSLTPLGGNEAKWGCVVCTFIAGLISQLKELHHISAKDARSMFCGFFPGSESFLCSLASMILFDRALPLIDQNYTADVVCNTLSYCKNSKCRLFPQNEDMLLVGALRMKYQLNDIRIVNVCRVLPHICGSKDSQKPYYDSDGDAFSPNPIKRGSYWRGRDCNDKDSTIYPGRDTLDNVKDENCNGIYGVNNVTGKTYEEMWCQNTGSMGVIAVGDSVTAHFGIPSKFVTVHELSREVFSNFSLVVENEFDWPMLSSITGFDNISKYKPNREGNMISVYSELLKRNKCNHRDYQNLGVNGASTSELSSIMDSIKRDRSDNVKPAFLYISMLGNDVCDGPNATTSPEEYYNRIIAALEKADSRLPSGSHVILSSLSDGRILYNVMHNRTHPIGSLHNDVTYSNFYDFLNCVDVSPCWGWLNTNETVRNATWAAAQLLNAQIPRILNESVKKFTNIQVHAFDDVMAGAMKSFDGPMWELIEPVDGFHPSQHGAALLGEYLFNKTLELGIVPPVNPFNGEIKKRFGDQGGF
ncbi:GPI inositol deacylase precursor [Trypanosoma theileri]|uniref:GPI inositol deacylase n=1 Tax=Trypanosoma theileri TaxID=67003 RepID=A0A1X0P8A1_9TRYP|nr:GPI inositol deacylase precursor [Trypanosoma theileri]ORC93177.1 GPI inositol deacylase precursor [Trypanosoma theileri]